ncbi:MAG: hypothetical protein JWL84_580 [Rhodospirillales bacterium]|nr:hypothetical protein [Rhodospirillales bacterium]
MAKPAKPDLRSQFFLSLTYREIRDALKKLSRHPDEFTEARLQAAIYGDPGNPSARERLRLKGQVTALRTQLETNGFIEPLREGWVTTERGHSLMNQKALKPILRQKGLSLVESAITTAARYNTDTTANRYVSKIFLFGSLLTEAKTVNDVDLIISVLRKEYATSVDWDDKERQRLRQTGRRSNVSWRASTEGEAERLIRGISPYISVAGERETLKFLGEKGEPIKLVYSFPE